MTLMRTIIELTDEQIKQLERICRRVGISRAEAVRRGVDLLLQQEQRREDEFTKALDAAFGMWKDRGIDGVEYQRKLRAEWDRDPWNQ